MMQKVLFTEFAELKQGDGKGPKYFAGKAYWLSPDQAVRWISEGIAENAPADMAAENEPTEYRPHPKDVRLVRVSRGRYDVLGFADHKYNDELLTAGDAEKLRQRVLAGEIATVVASQSVESEQTNADQPDVEEPPTGENSDDEQSEAASETEEGDEGEE